MAGATAPRNAAKSTDWRATLIDRGPFLVACVMLVALVAVYGSLRDANLIPPGMALVLS